MYSPHFTGKTVVPQGGSGLVQGLSVRRGQSQDSGPRGPGPPTPHCPESGLLGPVSRAGLMHSPHLPWLPDPSLSRSGPNCPKSLCQASVPTGPLFAMSPFLRCLRWMPPPGPSFLAVIRLCRAPPWPWDTLSLGLLLPPYLRMKCEMTHYSWVWWSSLVFL